MIGNLNAANDVKDIVLSENSDHRMAKALRAIISIGQAVLVVSALVLFAGSAFMALSSDFQDQIFQSVGMENKPNKMMLPLACASAGLVALAWFYVLYTLRRIVGTLISGDPFVPENISRLRLMWIVIALTEVFRMVFFSMFGPLNNDSGTFQIRIGVWFLVFVIATLSEAFRHGAAMRQEQELTI